VLNSRQIAIPALGGPSHPRRPQFDGPDCAKGGTDRQRPAGVAGGRATDWNLGWRRVRWQYRSVFGSQPRPLEPEPIPLWQHGVVIARLRLAALGVAAMAGCTTAGSFSPPVADW
jgi:hypothetical protein